MAIRLNKLLLWFNIRPSLQRREEEIHSLIATTIRPYLYSILLIGKQDNVDYPQFWAGVS